MEKITRAEAKAKGLKRYFTGKPCKHGHVCERWTEGTCIECKRASNNKWAKINGAKWKHDYSREYRQKNRKRIKERHKIFHAKWYLKNRDQKLAANKKYLHEHPEIGRRASLNWRNNNLERARKNAANWYAIPENNISHHNKRRARKLKANGTHAASDIKLLLKKQSYKCVYCRADLHKTKHHVDHIMPLVLGGSNDRTNLQILCQRCNSKKGGKHPVDFVRELGMLI